MYLIFKCFHGLVLIPILQSLQNPAKLYFLFCIVIVIQNSIGCIGFLVYFPSILQLIRLVAV